MADVTLQSFVVRLKYIVDESTAKHFHENVKKSIDGLNGVRLAALGALLGVEEMVRRSTGYYSSLDYMTRSVGASAEAIEKYRGALAGAGLSAQQADAVLGSLADKFRHPGFRNAAEGMVGPVTDAVDFMEKAARRYHDLLLQYNNDETAGPLIAARTQMEGLFGAQASQAMQTHARNWDLAEEHAARTAKIYKDMNVSAAEAGKQSTRVQLAFDDMGKSIQVAFIKLLTTAKPGEKTLLDRIIEVADRFSHWLADEGTQKKFTAMIDGLLVALDKIAPVLDHIGEAVVVLAGIWALNFAGKMVSNISTLLGALKGLGRAVAPGAAVARGGAAAGALGAAGTGLSILGPLGIALATAIGLGLESGAIGGEIAAREKPTTPTPKWREKLGLGPEVGGDWQKGWSGGHSTGAGVIWEWLTGGGGKKYQHGGIVPAGLHPGEMVLPGNISAGLQALFSTGSGGFVQSSRQMLSAFQAWFSGDTSYKPQIELGDETLERMGFKRGEQGGGGGGGGDAATTGPGSSNRAGVGGGGRMPGHVVGGSAPAGSLPTPGPTPEVSGEVDESLKTGIAFFMSKGMTREQATGVVARMAGESGGFKKLDPKVFGGYKGRAYGIVQALGSRRPAYLATGGDLMKQLEVAWGEMTGPEHKALAAILQAKTPHDSAVAMEKFERALNPAFTEKAAQFAERLYKLTNAKAGAPATAAPAAPDTPAATVAAAAGHALTQKQQYDADIAAGRRPAFPPTQKFNSRGEAISADPGGSTAREQANIASSMAAIKSASVALLHHAVVRHATEMHATLGHPGRHAMARHGQPAVAQHVAYHIYNNDDPSVTANRIKYTQNRDLSQLMRHNRTLVA